MGGRRSRGGPPPSSHTCAPTSARRGCVHSGSARASSPADPLGTLPASAMRRASSAPPACTATSTTPSTPTTAPFTAASQRVETGKCPALRCSSTCARQVAPSKGPGLLHAGCTQPSEKSGRPHTSFLLPHCPHQQASASRPSRASSSGGMARARCTPASPAPSPSTTSRPMCSPTSSMHRRARFARCTCSER